MNWKEFGSIGMILDGMGWTSDGFWWFGINLCILGYIRKSWDGLVINWDEFGWFSMEWDELGMDCDEKGLIGDRSVWYPGMNWDELEQISMDSDEWRSNWRNFMNWDGPSWTGRNPIEMRWI